MICKCLNCNRDYDIDVQGALCPHLLRAEGGKDKGEPWPKKEEAVLAADNRTWKKLPDEKGWWWYWTLGRASPPYKYYVTVSDAREVQYYIDEPFNYKCCCNEMGGYWLKAEVPTPPTAVERADAEAAWLKRFEGTMKADTERVVEDTKIEGEKHEPV